MKIKTISDLNNPTVKLLFDNLAQDPELKIILQKLRLYLEKNEKLKGSKREKFKNKIGELIIKLNNQDSSNSKKIFSNNLKRLFNLLSDDFDRIYIKHQLDEEILEVSLMNPETVNKRNTLTFSIENDHKENVKFQDSNELINLGYSTKKEYIPNTNNPVIAFKLSDIISEDFSCPYSHEILVLMKANIASSKLLYELCELFLQSGFDFSLPGNSFDRKVIQLLNKPYKNQVHQSSAEIKKTMRQDDLIAIRSKQILKELDLIASDMKFRVLSPGLIELFQECQFNYGIDFQSQVLNQDGIKRTLKTYKNCEFTEKKHNNFDVLCFKVELIN